MNWAFLLGLTVIAYLLGSFPSGFVLGKTLKGVDIRQFGSGKTGATNSLRTLGWQISLLVFILDMAKGAASVALPLLLLDTSTQAWGVLSCGLASMLGHDYSIFIGFKGGRGVANGIGQALVIQYLGMVFAGIVVLPIIIITRYISLASILGAVLLGIWMYIAFILDLLPSDNDPRYLIWATAIVILIISHHRDNIERLLNGTERKLGERAKPVTTTAANTSASEKTEHSDTKTKASEDSRQAKPTDAPANFEKAEKSKIS
jgi:glycerol-3-phosphate acyltransferase PlsY